MTMNRLQQYISMEDTEQDLPVETPQENLEPQDEAIPAPVVPEAFQEEGIEVPVTPEEAIAEEEVAEASEEAEEAAELIEDDAVVQENNEEIAGDLEEVQASVEHFASILEHGIRTKNFSVQTVATAQFQLDRLTALFGEKSPVTPSLEDYSKDNLEDYYTVSLESFRGFLTRVGHASQRLNNSLGDLGARGYYGNNFKKQAKAVNKAADASLQKLNGITSAEKKDIVVKDRRFAGAGNDLLASANSDLKVLTAAVAKGLKGNEAFLKATSDVLVEATNEGGVKKTGAIVAKAAQLKPPVDAYPAEAFSSGFLGGNKLVKGVAKEAVDTKSSIKALRTMAIPGVETNRGAKVNVTVSYSKAGAANVLQLAKAFAALAERAADETGIPALDTFTKVHNKTDRAFNGSEATSWEEGKDLDALATALPNFFWQHLKVYRFLNTHAISMAQALEELGTRMVKQLG